MEEGARSDTIAAEGAATACLMLGCLSVFSWVVPPIGLAVPVVGLLVGRRGLRSRFEGRARLGIGLCTLGLGLGLFLCYALINLEP